MMAFQELYSFGRFEKSLNVTFIVLIPKKCGALEANDYWPISLVNEVYKIISKIIANLLGEVIGKIISTPLWLLIFKCPFIVFPP